MYDTTSQSSFDEVDSYWMTEVSKYGEATTKLLLLGNKCDLYNEKVVDTDMA